jgi:hypothetical protein
MNAVNAVLSRRTPIELPRARPRRPHRAAAAYRAALGEWDRHQADCRSCLAHGMRMCDEGEYLTELVRVGRRRWTSAGRGPGASYRLSPPVPAPARTPADEKPARRPRPMVGRAVAAAVDPT